MGEIKAADVATLRRQTGAGMMDCKNALVEANGDLDKAIEILRKKGQKVAAKRADRDSHEGAAIAVTNQEKTVGIAIVLACETDFVGKKIRTAFNEEIRVRMVEIDGKDEVTLVKLSEEGDN